jgi:glycosyltransferase involved in cell wall biosynthesis
LPDGAVRAIGRIPDDQLGVVLREAQALVAPSRAEGFGLPLVEAMAVGVPVVCTDIPAFREVTAGAALSVPVADAAALGEALERVLSDPDERARLAAAGRTRSGAFDWDDVARRAWTLYRRVLGNPAP